MARIRIAVLIPLLAGLLGAASILPGPAAAVSALPGPAAAAGGPSTPPQQQPVPVYPVKPNTVHVPAMHAWRAPATSWPAAGTATAILTGSAAVRAGRLPVTVAPAAGAGVRPPAAPPSVTVSMLPRSAAAAAGLTGVLFTVSTTGRTSSGSALQVTLDYSGFAYAYGGDYASRLRLVELPACALTTPWQPACRAPAPVASVNNVRTSQLGADVAPPAVLNNGAEAPAVVLGATTSTSGSGGDYTATPLPEAGTWAAGDPSGAFTYSYPIQVPPVPGGLEPSISLNYDSQRVDGLTSSANGQASWLGDGWDYSPGYVERDYQSCQLNSASNEKTGDFCWSANNTTTLSLNGQSTTLVQDGSTGTWHAEADTNQKISYLTGTSNGTHDGDYWVITDPDGTSYYFGRNQLPGYVSGDATTGSSWNVPVYATSTGQPCYNATFTDSHCDQAWRWNLDYVTDPHGDAVAYFYNTETNYYASGSTVGSASTTANAAYQQGGTLSRIEYGLRAGAVYGHTPAAQVTFTTAADRTDVPKDLTCANGQSCDVISPTFWSRYRLASIGTMSLAGTALANVDSWTLSQTYPSTGDPTSPPALWLASITRSGNDVSAGGPAVSLPPVTFAGEALANRVMTQADLNSGYSIITRFRLTSVTMETGGTISVGYDTPGGACTSGSFPAPDANPDLCYPDFWSPPGVSNPVEDWFNKYVVTGVTQANTVGGGVAVATAYSYGGAAWHYDDDSLTRSKLRTWDQWRGFRTVTTQTGTAPDPVSQATDTYFQGMDGDYQSGGGTSPVTLTSTRGDKVTDSDQFAGADFEHIVYDGAGGGQVSDTITIPWTSAATASQSQTAPLPALKSYLTGIAQARTFSPLSSGGTRESDVSYTHDSDGRVTATSDVPDTSDASQDTCTTSTYASNTTAWILNLATEVRVVSVPCGTTATPADTVSDQLSFYDGGTALSADTPSIGDVTQTQLVTSYNGTTPVDTTESTTTYDEYGRVLTAADALGRKTTTSYTPATGAEPTSESVTDPMGLVTVTGFDPVRDLPVQKTDPAGYVTSQTYDGLGRLTGVWRPGHPKATAAADLTFSYTVSDSAPSQVTTNTLNDTGGYTTSETLYDSLGRAAETQAATPDGGRTITDVYYNSSGAKSLESAPYYTAGAPDDQLVAATGTQVPSQTGYIFDGAGRIVRQVSYAKAAETWETDTAYAGDATTVSYKDLVPGQTAGGTPQTTFTDGRGLTSKIYQYHAGITPDPSAPPSGYDVTSYAYIPAQKLATVTDAAGNRWSYGYDLTGDKTSESDPDAGASHSTYDAAGQLVSVTDARGRAISYTYDADGRKTAEYDTTGGALETTGDQIASWTYDTLARGLLSSSSTYYAGQAYTQDVGGYNSSELPIGIKTVIPAAQGGLAGSYTTGYKYDQDTMALSAYDQGAAGGLPNETVGIGYDTAGNPVSMASSYWTYVASLSYTELAQPLQYQLGPSSAQVNVTDSYDQQTQRLSGSQTVTVGNDAVVDATSYSYDNAGNVLSESDTPSGGPAQVQCFGYDYLGRLSQAWSQGSGGCASSGSASVEGGAAPYWDRYSYDVTGNLTSRISTQPSGAATTTTNSYPAAGSAQPHGLSVAVSASSVSGSSGSTSYGYDAAGHVTSIAGPAQSQALSWDDAGRLSSITTTPAGSATSSTTTYLYDASGNLLLQQDPGGTTLYLDDEQIVLSTAGTVSGTRYYAIGGTTTAARTSAGAVSYLVGDRQGTSLLSIDSGSAQSVTRRYFDPYGNPVGTSPGTWPGDRGFVGGTADPATGLTNLGAREYDPATGSFLSPDPLLLPYNPQDLDPYAYGAGNPATNSDPSGALWCSGGGYCGGGWSVHPGGGASISAGPCPGCHQAPAHNDIPAPAWGGGWVPSIWGSGWSPPSLKVRVPPAPKPVVRNKTNGSSASAATCPTVSFRFGGASAVNCRLPALPDDSCSGSIAHFLCHLVDNVRTEVRSHWRGIVQGVVDAGGAVFFVVCSGATWGVGAMGCGAITGSVVQTVTYATTGGIQHTLKGYLENAAVGGMAGYAGGGISKMLDVLEMGPTTRAVLSMTGGVATGVKAYTSMTPAGQQTPSDAMAAAVAGVLGAIPTPWG